MPYKDIGRRRAYGRDWMRRNPDKAREAMRRWRAAHPELRRLRNRADKRRAYARRRAEINALKAAWLAAHPEVRRAKDEGYRARKRAAAGSFSGSEWLELLRAYGGVCGYCGGPGPLQADHRVPLSRGGENTIGNLIPACGPCNRRKANKTECEFRALLDDERSGDG